MERLTNKHEADAQRVEYERRLANGYPRNTPEERFLRLAAYEDTGLEPEDLALGLNAAIRRKVGAEYYGLSPDQMDLAVDLFWADKDGRVVVLPCKVGDHVWVDGREAIVEEFFGYETERYLHAQFYDNFQYIDIPFEEVGKTVFLTCEEAEAALKGGAE